MLVRIFWWICGAVVIATALLLISGNFTMPVAVVVGFIAFGLTFTGMINVLPVAISHPAPVKSKSRQSAEVGTGKVESASPFGTWKSA